MHSPIVRPNTLVSPSLDKSALKFFEETWTDLEEGRRLNIINPDSESSVGSIAISLMPGEHPLAAVWIVARHNSRALADKCKACGVEDLIERTLPDSTRALLVESGAIHPHQEKLLYLFQYNPNDPDGDVGNTAMDIKARLKTLEKADFISKDSEIRKAILDKIGSFYDEVMHSGQGSHVEKALTGRHSPLIASGK